GVELATDIAERFDGPCAKYHIPYDEPEMILVELSDRILPSLDGKSVGKSLEAMQAMGIRILTNSRIKGMEERGDDTYVLLDPGAPLATRTMIWTGGIRISDLLKKTGAETGPQGRVVV